MASTKRNALLEEKAPQFDLAKSVQVATVKDLLQEINDEIAARQKKIHDLKKVQGAPQEPIVDVPAVTFRSLAKTLSFVKEISGVEIKSELEEVDIMTLKVVKLLFSMSDKRVDESGKRNNSRNIFALLQRPKPLETNVETAKKGRKDPATATMESCTGTTITRDPLGEALIGAFVDALSQGVDPEKLATMEAILAGPEMFEMDQAVALSGASAGLDHALQDQLKPKNRVTRSDAEKLLDHIALGTGAVEDLFFRLFEESDSRMADAFRMLTREIRKIGFKRIGRTNVPVHEAMYVHARTLGLQHFMLHHRAYVPEIHVMGDIPFIERDIWSFCEEVGDREGISFGPKEYVIPLGRFEEFATAHACALRELVERVTDLVTPESVHKKDVKRAGKIARWAVYRRYDRCPPENPRICVLDVIAALCSVRYQQKKKTKYEPYWEGQQSQGTSPQRMLDASIKDPDLGLHQGIFLLYYNRYKDYLAAFMGNMETRRAFAEFELCRLDGYLAATQTRSIQEFVAATQGFNHLCLILALYIVYANLGRGRPG